MIRSLGMLLLVGFPVMLAARPSGNSDIFPYPINQVTLDNGLKVVSIPFDSPGIVAY